MVNITYYKQKLKRMIRSLRREKNKENKSELKIRRLESSIMDCNKRLKLKQQERKEKGKNE